MQLYRKLHKNINDVKNKCCRKFQKKVILLNIKYIKCKYIFVLFFFFFFLILCTSETMLNFTRPYRIFLLVSFQMATVKLQRRFLLRDEQNGSPSIGDLHHEERVKSLNKCDTSSTLRCFLLRRVPLRFRAH